LEAANTASAVLIGEPGVPTQTQVDGQTRIHAPVVLYERAPLDAREIEIETSGLRELGHLAQHEVRHIVSRKVVVEVEYAILFERIGHGSPNAQGLSAEMQFMAAFDVSHVFAIGLVTAVEGAEVIAIDI